MIGYIGFFDILGYQSFLKNNTDEAIQDEVLDFISSVEKPSADLYKKVFPLIAGGELEPQVKAAFEKIKWLVFSDTIVFTLEPGSTKDEVIYFLAVLGAAKNLMFKMFDYGLPLRGGLHYGEYKFTEHSMAGRGIVEAYESGKVLNLSTCVLTDQILERLRELEKVDVKLKSIIQEFICPYKTPLSTGVRETLFNLKSESIVWVGSHDLREFVHEKFWAHGKDLGDSRAVEKVEETERFLIYCAMQKKKMLGI